MLRGLFDAETILFYIGTYGVSGIELLAVVTGIISVWYAARTHLLTWPTGMVNAIFLFVFFFQLQLYADMLLQIYFFVVCAYGWWKWKDHSQRNDDRQITWMRRNTQLLWLGGLTAATLLFGWCVMHLNLWLPDLFKEPAAYPFADGAIAMMSVAAQLLMARKKTESWLLWIAIDLLAIVIYALKGAYVLSGEYVLFLCLAAYGFIKWKKAAQPVSS